MGKGIRYSDEFKQEAVENIDESANKSLQLTNNTPLRSVLWSTEFKR